MYVVEDRVPEPLYVITPLFNPVRFKSRWKVYQRFQKHIVDAGGVLLTGEAAFGAREHAVDPVAPDAARVTCAMPEMDPACRHDSAYRGQHRYLRYRTRAELWLKENLCNVIATQLPHDWQYVAFVDCDVTFLRPNIIGETIHQLQHYDVVQMFSHAQDLGPNSEVLEHSRHRESFMGCYTRGHELPARGYYGRGGKPAVPDVWSGLAWAWRRSAFEHVGGLIDFAIHGGGDWHMAFCLVGQGAQGLRRDLHPHYRRRVLGWQDRCERYVRRNVGMVEGTVVHHWHGKKADRRYPERHKMLAELHFDPDHDLKYDAQGLYQLVDHGDVRSIQLRDVLRMHARARNEDSVDVG